LNTVQEFTNYGVAKRRETNGGIELRTQALWPHQYTLHANEKHVFNQIFIPKYAMKQYINFRKKAIEKHNLGAHMP